MNSATSRSLAAIAQKKVYHCPESQSFIVEGSKGDKYAVTLAPKEVCQCPSVSVCYHIIAVRMSVGIEAKNDKVIYNLTQLRKNTRKRPDKCAGKKKPRPIDKLDANESIIIPAPDSILNNTQLEGTENLPQFTSTPTCATPKRTLCATPKTRKNTPKSILKRKLETEFVSASKKMRLEAPSNTKKLKLSLPKTRQRKSLASKLFVAENDLRESVIDFKDSDFLHDTVLKSTTQNDIVIDKADFVEESTIPYTQDSIVQIDRIKHKKKM